jgi:hypothetical protein
VLDRLHRVTCPTFVRNGCYDNIAPVANGQAITDRITNASAASIGCADARSRPNRLSTTTTVPSRSSAVST